MAYFPFYTDISGKRCVIIGGGTVALRKVQIILGFGADVTVIAPKICYELEGLPVERIYRKFEDSDLDGAYFAVYAADDKELSAHVHELCLKKHIMLNSVDDIDNCDFIFPAMVKKDNITISISTGATSPVFAKYLKTRIEELLDEHTLEVAALMTEYRNEIKKAFSNYDLRASANEILLEMCLNSDELPSDEKIRKVLGIRK